ncbi:MAG: polyamine aminopropyltransferase [Calditrichaeota bacterium]|nr:MAG: polyamine aminopropyltransferase [Calditrichota bacterium]
MAYSLLFCVIVIASCGLIYELIAATLASYLLGDSVTQFSTIIGIYLFSMGIGSYLSKYFDKKLLDRFIEIEIAVGFFGGILATCLFFLFEFVDQFRIILYCFVTLIGILVGLEIPILLRILKDKIEFKDLVSKVLALDYIGGLFASLVFPFFFVPNFGLISTSFLFGLLNSFVAFWAIWIFRERLEDFKKLISMCSIVILVLLIGLFYSEKISETLDNNFYSDKIIFTKKSPYQKLVVTSSQADVKLFINGNLQFSSLDEYRYHEALVLPALSFVKNPQNILILGGGDGLAIREILTHVEDFEKITLVDLDPEMTKTFSENLDLVRLNDGSLLEEKVEIFNEDAFIWTRNCEVKYDLIICDFPDPSNYSLGKLYSNTFYNYISNILKDEGILTVQSTSPFFAKKSFWCIENTIRSTGFQTKPYHIFVPTFGEWGFVLASKKDFQKQNKFDLDSQFLNNEILNSMFKFPKDISEIPTEINKLNNQILIRYYSEEEERANKSF